MRNKSRDAVPASAACPRGARLWGVGLLAAAAFLGGCSKPPPAEEPVRAVKLLTVGESWIRNGRIGFVPYVLLLHGGIFLLAMGWLLARHNGWFIGQPLRPARRSGA